MWIEFNDTLVNLSSAQKLCKSSITFNNRTQNVLVTLYFTDFKLEERYKTRKERDARYDELQQMLCK